MIPRILAILLALPWAWLNANAQETTPPPKWATFEVQVLSPSQLAVRWDIAPGYFLFRNKFRFQTTTPNLQLQTPQYPPSTHQEIAHLGTQEVYRGSFTLSLPLVRENPQASALSLTVLSQGCDDNGHCFPQQQSMVTIELPPLDTSATPSPLSASSNALGARLDIIQATPSANKPLDKLLNHNADNPYTDSDFLAPEQAFSLQVEPQASNLLVASWTIAEGYYLYRHRLQFSTNQAHSLQPVQLPEGEDKEDPEYGQVKVFHHFLEVPLFLTQSAARQEVELTVAYQGCASAGLCYPPETKTFRLTLPDTPPVEHPPLRQSSAQSEQDRIAGMLAHSSLGWVLLAFFGFGLLLALTPCVFPMIPILSGIIVGQGEKITAWRGFMISLVYVLAMAVTYALVGILAGLVGENLQSAMQNPWVLSAFSLVFVLLSLSMFGFYELQMPGFIQQKLAGWSNRQQGGTLIGSAIMGFLSALIVGPCVAAPLAGALIYISQSGNWMLGGAALFVMSLGMGVPLLLVGASAGSLLPRAGSWMEHVKAVFGVLLLAVAVWMMERVLPGPLIMGLWAILLIFPAIYLRALEPLSADAPNWAYLRKSLGVLMLSYGLVLLIGAAGGSEDPLQPLRVFQAAPHTVSAEGGPSTAQNRQHLAFKTIHSVADLEAELSAAQAAKRWVMLDFYADWCVSCKELEKFTFAEPKVQKLLADTILLQADVTANTQEHKALMKKFTLFGPPGIIFYSPSGQELAALRVIGYQPPDKFSAHLQQVFAAP